MCATTINPLTQDDDYIEKMGYFFEWNDLYNRYGWTFEWFLNQCAEGKAPEIPNYNW